MISHHHYYYYYVLTLTEISPILYSYPILASYLRPTVQYLLSEARRTLAKTSSSQNSPPSWQSRPCW